MGRFPDTLGRMLKKMRQILRHGTNKIETITCWACNCKFSFSELDIHYPAGCEKGDGLVWVKCPDCGQILFISTEHDVNDEIMPLNGENTKLAPSRSSEKKLVKDSPFKQADKPVIFQDEITGWWHLLSTGANIIITVKAITRDEVIRIWNERRN